MSRNACGVAAAPRSTGFADRAGRARAGTRRARAGLGRVDDHHVDAAGVADDADPGAGRQRLVDQQPGGVEQLAEAVAADDAGLGEQRVHGGVGGGRGRGVRGAGPLPGRRPAALDRQHRLAPGQGAGDAGEPARVADRLEVERDGSGGRVVVPVRQQVVAAHVGLVAEGDEARQPGAGPADVVEDRDADGARLRGDRQAARLRLDGGERGVQPQRRVGVEDAEAVGADDADAVAAGDADQLGLGLAPVRPGLAEPGGEDHGRPDPGGAALLAARRRPTRPGRR